MVGLEDIIDDFAEKAPELVLQIFEAQQTFVEALRILSKYATSRFGMDDFAFNVALSTSLSDYMGPKETKDDVWQLMVTMKDARPPDSSRQFGQLLSQTQRHKVYTPSRYNERRSGRRGRVEEKEVLIEESRSRETQLRDASSMLPGCCLNYAHSAGSNESSEETNQVVRIHGFGTAIPGSGKVAPVVTTSSAYFSNQGRTYKVRLKGGKLQFVKYPKIESILSIVKSVGVPWFNVSWNINFAETPANQILSAIFQDGTTHMIDWVIALIYSRDIKISKTSTCTGFVPASLVDSDEEGMCLTQPIRKEYFVDRKFLYNEESKTLYWVPCEGVIYMKVLVLDGPYNSFKRVDVGSTRDLSIFALQSCTAIELEKDFV